MDDITESDGPRVLLRSTPRDENAPTAKSPLMFDLDTTDCLSRHLCLRRDIWPLPVLAPLHSEYERIREIRVMCLHRIVPLMLLHVVACCRSLAGGVGRLPCAWSPPDLLSGWLVLTHPIWMPPFDARIELDGCLRRDTWPCCQCSRRCVHTAC